MPFYVENLEFKKKTLPPLNGLCHEDFAILGQFCAKIIT